MKTERSCLICNSKAFRKLHSIKEAVAGERFSVLKCCECGFIFTHPLLSEKQLSRFYTEDYYAFTPKKPHPLTPEGTSIKAKLSANLKSLLLADTYNYSSDKEYSSFLFPSLLPIYKRIAAEIYPSKAKEGKVLDIGCGCGEYLVRLKQLGWHAYGVEINKKAAQYGKTFYGVDIICGEIFDADFPDGFFDAITMFAALEHVSEPMRVLREVSRILKKGGQLIVSVPNVSDMERKIFGKFWWGWDIPRHLWHFSPRTLEMLLEKAGFTREKTVFHADMYDLPKNLGNIFAGLMPGGNKISARIFSSDTLRPLTKYLMTPAGIAESFCGCTEKFTIFSAKP